MGNGQGGGIVVALKGKEGVGVGRLASRELGSLLAAAAVGSVGTQ